MAIASLALFAAVLHFATCEQAHLILLDDPGEAVCLDGSPPGYYFRRGSGEGLKKAIIFMEGGGVCNDEEECVQRSKTRLGSSKFWPPTAEFSGILSDSSDLNPDFYNWNVVFINYCDGACHSGYVSHPVDVQGTTIYFRGNKIIQALFDSFLKNGLQNATDVILTGCSAGGLATYIHADYVQSILPPSIKYRAISDAGYFIDAPNVDGEDVGKPRAQYIFKMQNLTGALSPDCLKFYADSDPSQCFGAQFLYPFIKAPIFSLNSQYDTWQIENTLELKCHPPNCTAEQMEKLQQFYQEFKQAVQPVINSPTNGAFLDSCFVHCQSLNTDSWTGVKVGGQTAAETFANWYFERSGKSKEVDCAYPCNNSC